MIMDLYETELKEIRSLIEFVPSNGVTDQSGFFIAPTIMTLDDAEDFFLILWRRKIAFMIIQLDCGPFQKSPRPKDHLGWSF